MCETLILAWRLHYVEAPAMSGAVHGDGNHVGFIHGRLIAMDLVC
jgi:hypothetical protein